MDAQTICPGLFFAIVFMAVSMAAVSYADYVVAQFDRYSGYRGATQTTIGRLLGLPWQTPTQLIFLTILVGLGTFLLTLIHWAVVLIIGVLLLGAFIATLLADTQKLDRIVAQIPPSKAEIQVLRPSLLPVSSMLVGRRGEYKGVEIECVPNMRIGRGTANNLNLKEKLISRKHAVLRYSQDMWFIQDEDSATGIYINGQRERARKLNHGDMIKIGSSEFEFREG